ncbi:MAG: tetratricopeptide repeat protein [Myxococcota bacterium]|nr:tetratricopeptide repeat protein [Myxococcota bacterium]
MCLTGLAYGNIYDNRFHLDDVYRVVENPEVRYVAPAWRHFVDPGTMSTLPSIIQYRPLLPLTLSLNHAAGGYEPAGYHLFNLALHMMAVLLGFFLLMELLVHWTSRPPPSPHGVAVTAAALFAIHPVSGIPVNYICARDLLMMEVGLLGFLLLYARIRRGAVGPWGPMFAGAALVLSLLAKKNGVAAPGLVLAFEITCAGGSLTRRETWRPVLVTGALVGAYLAVVRYGLGFSDMNQIVDGGLDSVFTYPLTQLKVHVFHYLPVYFLPWLVRQAPQVEAVQTALDPLVILGGLGILFSVVYAWRIRVSLPVVSFLILAYWLLFAPTSSVVPTHAMAVHYRLYPSSLFLCLVLAMALWRWTPPRGAWTSVVGLLLLLGSLSWQHNASWKTQESLWTRSVQHGGSALAYVNLGVDAMSDDLPEAARFFESALELEPGYVVALVDLGLVRVHQGRTEEGLALFEQAIERAPQRSKTYYWQAHALAEAERYTEAMEASEKAARQVPRNLSYRHRAGMDAQAAGEYARSIPHLQAALALDPEHREARFALGFAFQKTGKNLAAIDTYRSYLKRTPDNAQVWFNLGYALMEQARCDEAVEAFRETLRLRPSYTEAGRLLKRCEDPP